MENDMLAERLFEQTRRFTDSWVSNCRHSSRRAPSSRHPTTGPCQNSLIEVQHGNVHAVFQSGNPAFNKLGALLLYLTEQLRLVGRELEEDFCPKLLVFGEEPQAAAAGGSAEGDLQIMLATALPFLRAVVATLDRLCLLLENLLLQLGSLCAEHTRKATILQGEHAKSATLAAADSLAWLVRVEVICARNPNLTSAFSMFARMLQAVAGEPGDFQDAEVEAARKLSGEVAAIQARLLGKGLFRGFLEERMGWGREAQMGCSSPAFIAAASGILRDELAAVSGRMTDNVERIGDRESLLGCLALGVLLYRLGKDHPVIDKKLLRQLLDLHVQVALIPVASELMVQPASFLSQYLPMDVDAYIPAAYARQAGALRGQQLDRNVQEFASRLQHTALVVAAVVGRFATYFSSSKVTEGLLTQMATAICQALAVANQVRQALLEVVCRLKLGGAPVGSSSLRLLLHACCQIKAIEQAFQVHDSAIAEALPHLVTHVNSGTQGLLAATRAGVRAKIRQAAGTQSVLTIKSKRERAVAALQEAAIALDAADILARGPVSAMQIAGLTTCLEAVETTGSVPEADLGRLHERLATLRLLTDLHNSIRKACCCDFLYFNRHLLDAGLADVLTHPHESRKLPYLLAAFNDAHRLLNHTILDPAITNQAHEEEIMASVRTKLLLPVCDTIETQLRLHHHSIQDGGLPAAGKKERDFGPLLRLPPLCFHTHTIIPRELVGRELTSRFYKHTAVALHDWQTYAQLAALARDRLSLDVDVPDLPGLVIDPGLDLVEVIRELPAFTAGYAYCLVSNTFLQRADGRGGTKHLTSLTTDHVVNALRRHGSGLADAAVNSVYRVLTRQLAILSQWLSQDQVKSRLAKEARNIAEGSQSSGAIPYAYPFSAAETLTDDFRRLGAAGDGSTYLDYLGRLITEVGNAVALVRVIQQAKFRQRAAAAQYLLPQKGGVPATRFMEALGGGTDPPGEGIAQAARLLDATVDNLSADSRDEPEYYTVLVRVFSEQRRRDNANLSTLYAAATALTLNCVEAALLSKEQLPHRRGGQATAAASAFTDDGFAMGLAFLLKILEQDSDFRALCWFDSVVSHFSQKQEELGAEGRSDGRGGLSGWLGKLGGSREDPQAQNRELARARLQSYAGEFKLLADIFSCAQLLFDRS